MPAEVASVSSGRPLAAGTIPIAALNNASNKAGNAQKGTRAPAVKLKVVIRRLPPGLTQTELETALGEDWKVDAGRVTWSIYKPGKTSKDVAKPSRPSRAYFHLSEQCHLETLATHVQTTSFTDARNTANDPALIGPPVLEFAMYQRTPTSKMRHDPRQGLIDQDSEFIEFLESLTNPTIKPQNIDASREGKDEPVKVTPLIQHLRDKKAAKEKSKGDKSSKGGRGSKAAATAIGAKAEAKSKEPTDKADAKAGRRRKADGSKKEVAVQQAPKAIASAPVVTKPEPTKTTTTEGRKRERPAGGAGAAASLIQRDLGLRGGRAEAGRRGGAKAASSSAAAVRTTTSENNPTTSTADSTPTAKPTTSSRAPKTAVAPSTAPAPSVLRRQQPNAPSTTQQTTPQASVSKTAPSSSHPKIASVSPTATQAFLKHANPSQGITEATLQAALSVFGNVSNIEIDKRKGFAYATFAEAKGLQAAAAAGLIPVAQGNVQVLERKDRSKPAASSESGMAAGSASSPGAPAQQTNSGSSRGGRGGGRSGRGRGGNARGGGGTATGGSATAAKDKPATTAPSASNAT